MQSGCVVYQLVERAQAREAEAQRDAERKAKKAARLFVAALRSAIVLPVEGVEGVTWAQVRPLVETTSAFADIASDAEREALFAQYLAEAKAEHAAMQNRASTADAEDGEIPGGDGSKEKASGRSKRHGSRSRSRSRSRDRSRRHRSRRSKSRSRSRSKSPSKKDGADKHSSSRKHKKSSKSHKRRRSRSRSGSDSEDDASRKRHREGGPPDAREAAVAPTETAAVPIA
eukprot:Opistho-2@91533